MSEPTNATEADPGHGEGIDPAALVPYLGVVACYALTVLLGVALADDAASAGLVMFENPGDVGNVGVFAVIVLVGTAIMLAIFRYDRGLAVLRLVLVVSFGNLVATGFVLWTGIGRVVVENALLMGLPASPAPIAVFAVTSVVLWFYPEWYVLDAVGIVAGAAGIAMIGLGFGPLPIVVLLVAWAGYDAYAVYGSGHMKDLAEGGIGLKVPILFVVPRKRGYSFLDDDAVAADPEDASDDGGGTEAPGEDDEGEVGSQDAMMLGLGDALIPGMLAVSAGQYLDAPAVVPALNANLPAVGSLIGGLVGMGALLFILQRYEGAHAGLPPLNAGVLGGYLLGALAAGIPLATAVGL